MKFSVGLFSAPTHISHKKKKNRKKTFSQKKNHQINLWEIWVDFVVSIKQRNHEYLMKMPA